MADEKSSEFERFFKKWAQSQTAAPKYSDGGLEAALNKTAQSTNPLIAAFEKLPGYGKETAQSLLNAKDAFIDLSKAGAGFRGDLIGLSVAAANTRLTLGEFANLIKENRENFIGLGGSVTRGAEAFATLSKRFMDEPATDNLRLLGYTSKDLNEVLALQLAYTRYSQKLDQEGQKQSIEAATKLATEMDLMARLTGKSREEQAEAMKKASQDAAVESKFRLIGATKGPEEEAKARALFAQQYNEAQLRGQGQMFKEVFATGQIVTKEAATQAAINSQQAAATRDMALATQRGQEKEAQEAAAKGRAAAYEDSRDISKLQLGTLNHTGNVASKAIADNITATRGYHDALRQLQLSEEGRGKSAEELDKMARDRALKEMQGRDDQGKKVNELGSAMILFEARAKDAAVAINEGLLEPLRKLDPAFKEFNNTLRGLSENFGGTGKGIRPAIADAAQQGREGKAVENVSGLGGDLLKAVNIGSAALVTGATEAGTVIKNAGKTFNDAANFGIAENFKKIVDTFGTSLPLALQKGANAFIESMKNAGQQVPKRQGGSVQMTGNLFEDWGKGTLVELHGLEGVVRPDEMTNIAKGMTNQGAAKAIDNLKKQISSMHPTNGIDLNSISKDISTTVSAPIPKTPQTIELKQPTTPSKVEVINWPKDFGKSNVLQTPPSPVPKKEEAAKPVEAAKPTPTQASVRAIDNKIEKTTQEPLDIKSVTGAAISELQRAETAKSTPTQASVRAVDNSLDLPKPDFKALTSEFGEEMKLPFGSMMDEFGSSFEKTYNDIQSTMGKVDLSGFNLKLEEINKDLIESLPVIEIQKSSEEMSGSARRFSQSYKEAMNSSVESNEEHLVYLNEKEQKRLEREKLTLGEIEQLEAKAQEQQLTYEEQLQLESLKHRIDVLKTNEEYNKAEIEATKKALNDQLELSEGIQGQIVGVTEKTHVSQLDSVTQAKDAMMLEANEITSEITDLIPTDSVIAAKDAMMLEANNIAEDIESVMSAVDIPPIQVEDVLVQARDNFMLEANEIAEDINNITKSIPAATTTLSDMTMAADEVASEMADLIPTDSVIAAKDAMMLEANNIAEDIESVMSGIEFKPIEIDDLIGDTDYISSAIKNALPFDEFAGVDKAINEQEKMLLFADDMRGGLDEVAHDIQANLGSMLDEYQQPEEEDTDYISSAIKNALPFDEFAGLDKAIELQKNIQKNTSGMDVLAEDGSVAQGIKINPETGERYYTDIPEESKKSLDSQLKTTNPFFNEKGELDLNTIHLPGMKKYGADLKSQTQSISKKEENESSAETARLKRQAEKKSDSETSNNESKTSESKSTATVTKDATLNDVVKQLSSLNKNMQNLIDQNQKLLGDQLRAVKANNKNNFVGVY
jgi:hypothetical protein